MSLFGVGAGEALLVLVLALIVVGPQRFPEIARQGGRWYRIARQYTDEVMKDVRAAVDEIETEIQMETEDIKSLSSVGEDLQAIREDVDQVTKESASDAQEALEDSAAAANVDAASEDETESTARRETSVRPSRRSQDA
jgi:sec-independent protein translocase protein TatB